MTDGSCETVGEERDGGDGRSRGRTPGPRAVGLATLVVVAAIAVGFGPGVVGAGSVGDGGTTPPPAGTTASVLAGEPVAAANAGTGVVTDGVSAAALPTTVADDTATTNATRGSTVEVADLGFDSPGNVSSVTVDLSAGTDAGTVEVDDVDAVTVELYADGTRLVRLDGAYDGQPTGLGFGINVTGVDRVRVLANVSDTAEDGDAIDAAVGVGDGRSSLTVDTGGTQPVVVDGTGLVDGEVVNRSDEPVPNVTVLFTERTSETVVARTETRADGTFGPLELPPGNYTAAVSDPLYPDPLYASPLQLSFTNFSLGSNGAVTVPITTDELVYADRIEVSPANGTAFVGETVPYTVTVTDQYGDPLVDVDVSVSVLSDGPDPFVLSATETTDASGQATFQAGATRISTGTIRFTAENVTGGVDPATTATATFVQNGEGVVAGRVVNDATTDGLEDARVWAVPDAQYEANERYARFTGVDDDAVFWFRVIDEATGEVVDNDAYDVRNAEYNRSGTVDPNADTGVRDVESLNVSDPAAGEGFAVVDADGDGQYAFTLARLANEGYSLQYSVDAPNASASALRDGNETDADREVEAFQNVTAVDATGTLTGGTGPAATFRPTANMTLAATASLASLVGANLVDAPGFVNTYGVDTGGTDATGGFVLNELYTDMQAGRGYVVFASKPGYSTDVADVFVEEDGDTKINADSSDEEALHLTPETATTNLAPEPAFTRSDTTPTTGQSVTFDASKSVDRDGSIVAYRWRFGDGTTASGATVSHAYDDDGWYDVRLLVVDGSGATTTLSRAVVVENTSPTARIEVSPANATTGEPVAFDAANSTDADGSIAAYDWTFGDGNATTGATATHAYAANGTYAVTLTVTDDDGATGTATTTVAVTASTTPFPDGVPGVGDAVPTNGDADPELEDVDGSGTFGFLDVVALLFADWSAINDDPAQRAALNFDGTDGVGFLDVVALLFEL